MRTNSKYCTRIVALTIARRVRKAIRVSRLINATHGVHGTVLLLAMALALPCMAQKDTPLAAPKAVVPQQWSGSAAGVTTETPQQLASWWDRFGDPLLNQYVAKALAQSPSIRTALSKLRASRAALRLAHAGNWPTLTATAAGSRSDTESTSSYSSSHGGTFNPAFDASWEPDINGAQRSTIAGAQADYLATEFDLRDAQVSLAAEVATDYVDIRSYQQRLQIARDNAKSETETLEITQWREQAGLSTELDVQQALATRDQTQAQIPTLESSLAQAEHALEILLGEAPGSLQAELAAVKPVPAPPEQIAIGIPADTLRQRPDLRAAETRILAESARWQKQKAGRMPSLSLSGSLGVEITSGALTGGTSLISSLAATLTQTVFDKGRIRQQIEAQGAVEEQAVITYESDVLTALKDVEDALTAFARDRERLASLQTAAAAARSADQLARIRYEAGQSDFTTVLETERTVLTLEDTLASTTADRTTALIQLYKALGGGWSQQPVTTTGRK
jgi:NodT family efflux transporter outer membrane factor (OMF) lipoprotein